MVSEEIFNYFVELESFLSAFGQPFPDRNSLEAITRRVEDHISITDTFAELMSYFVPHNVAQRRICLILEDLCESLKEILAEITSQMETDAFSYQRGRPR